MKNRKASIICMAAGIVAALRLCSAQDEMGIDFSGGIGLSITRISKSSLKPYLDTQKDRVYYSGSWIQTISGSVGAGGTIGERFSFGTSLGGYIWHPIQTGSAGFTSEMERRVSAWVTGASAQIIIGNPEKPPVVATVGLFGINTSPDVKNFGGYLLKGGVYPAYLYNGGGGAGVTGVQIHNASLGEFVQDLLLLTETNQYPYFDFSIVYLASYTIAGFAAVGAGINFFRLIPAQKERTSPTPWIDAATGEKGSYTLSGQKVMGRLTLDFKPLLKSKRLDKQDLKLYCEVSVFGLQNQPHHQRPSDSTWYEPLFDDITQRIAVVGGFNFPTFKLLNRLCAEVEYFGSPYDYRDLNDGNPLPMPIPTHMTDGHQDDWRWAVCLDKEILNCLSLNGKVASDHFRTNDERGWARPEIFTLKPDEWYWTISASLRF